MYRLFYNEMENDEPYGTWPCYRLHGTRCRPVGTWCCARASRAERLDHLALFGTTGKCQKDIFEATLTSIAPQIVERANSDDLPLSDDRHPVAHTLGDLEDVR